MLNAALYPKGATLGAPAPSAASRRAGPDGRRDRRGRRGPGRQGRAADDGARRDRCSQARRPTATSASRSSAPTRAKLKAAVKAAKLSKSVTQEDQLHDDQDHGHARGQGRPHVRRARAQAVGVAHHEGLDRRKVKPIDALV